MTTTDSDTSPSLAAFYRRRDRRESPEADYGVHWHEHGHARLQASGPPPWRVSYVKKTGELYATPTSGDGPVRVLGVIPADPCGCWYATADRILRGWDDADRTNSDLGWISRRLAAARR